MFVNLRTGTIMILSHRPATNITCALKKGLTTPVCGYAGRRLFGSGGVSSQPNSVPFAKAKKGNFFQEAPYLEHPFKTDNFFKGCLKRLLPAKLYETASKELSEFGTRVATDVYRLGRECELNQPYLRIQDAWGNTWNEVVTCEAWKKLKDVSAVEGLVATAYEDKYGDSSRLVQMSKLFLFGASSGLYNCPLAMTDGAAKTLMTLGLKDHGEYYERLTSRDPQQFWTSGQWMTEKRGGSDVAGGTETIAKSTGEGKDNYRLYGYKFFSSATDADIALTLARIADPQTGNTAAGTSGLSLFLLKVNQPDHLNVIRLKQKLGTRQLPTGELLLDGMEAELISAPGRGVASISPMLSITRMHNAGASLSSMRRIISLARDYSQRRTAFGRLLKDHALHVKTLASLELEYRAGLCLFLESARLTGLEERGRASESDRLLLRLLLPVTKLYTGKQCIGVVSEGLESFGGQGYMEDTGLPALLRDAQVTPIWEGTTNILSLDVLRSLAKSEGRVLESFKERINKAIDVGSSNPDLTRACEELHKSQQLLLKFAFKNTKCLDYFARDLAFGLARTLAGAFLLEHAAWTGASAADVITAKRWILQLDLLPQAVRAADLNERSAEEDRALVFEGYHPDNLLTKYY